MIACIENEFINIVIKIVFYISMRETRILDNFQSY